MRPAPPRQPRPEDDAATSTEPSLGLDGQSNRVSAAKARGRRRRIGFTVLLVAVVLAGLGVWLATRGSTPSPRTRGPVPTPTASPTVPVRPAFAFSVRSRQPAAPGKLKRGAADDASAEIGSNLSAFYDSVFMDP